MAFDFTFQPNQPTSSAQIERAAAISRARRWLFEHALPFWIDRGIDRRRGGFVDLVGVDGSPCDAPKRTFVQARQIYAFATAGELSWNGPWREAVEMGLHTLDTAFLHPEWGYVHNVGNDNGPRESHRDLYDQAFVAMAKATAARVLGRCDLLDQARTLLTAIETHWAYPSGGFYEGELPPQPPRRQNPHMHLLEAMIAAAATPWSQPEDLSRANRLAAFFAERLFQAEFEVLPEYFDLLWKPIANQRGLLVEPGHHFEWAWLLCRLVTLGGNNYSMVAHLLWQFAEHFGIDRQRGVCIDEVNEKGAVISSRARLWPQTERLKAALASEALGRETNDPLIVDCCAALERYLATPMAGAIFDKLLPDGGFVEEPARASSLYHVICAYSELFGARPDPGSQ